MIGSGLISKSLRTQNGTTVRHVVTKLLERGVKEFVICPGGRNSPFVQFFENKMAELPKYYFFDERSAAFFALGRARALNAPVAVVTTSGTAVGELLPAMMEGFYSCVPLIALTADRPRSLRFTGAPQVVNQVGIFTTYTSFAQDLEGNESCCIDQWDGRAPAHLNVCLEDPLRYENFGLKSSLLPNTFKKSPLSMISFDDLYDFFRHHQNILVIVGGLDETARPFVRHFLQKLKAPLIVEANSGLREDIKVQEFACSLNQWPKDIQGVLRIGDVPTTRLWRDLEKKRIPVFSLSDKPFSGLSHGTHIQCEYSLLDTVTDCPDYSHYRPFPSPELPTREQAIFTKISEELPSSAHIYLGNSLPIRHFDRWATHKVAHPFVTASRGANGIDGQLSTFFGLCTKKSLNVGLFGDLTLLYDMSSFWILDQLKSKNILIIVINNGGGKIFKNMFMEEAMQNSHFLTFEDLARFWNIDYCRMEDLTQPLGELSGYWLIEVNTNYS